MTPRELTAYALIAAMLIALACRMVWTRRNSPERKYRRQRRRRQERRRECLEQQAADPDSGDGQSVRG